MDIEGWLRKVERPIYRSSLGSSSRSATSVKWEGSVEGALFGETILFTGALSIPRRQAADGGRQQRQRHEMARLQIRKEKQKTLDPRSGRG